MFKFCVDLKSEEDGKKYNENNFKINVYSDLKLSIYLQMEFATDTKILNLL